jgi:hypothetical protein
MSYLGEPIDSLQNHASKLTHSTKVSRSIYRRLATFSARVSGGRASVQHFFRATPIHYQAKRIAVTQDLLDDRMVESNRVGFIAT